jgi:hypothetical protein
MAKEELGTWLFFSLPGFPNMCNGSMEIIIMPLEKEGIFF